MFKKLVFQGFSVEDLPKSEWDRIADVCKNVCRVATDEMPGALEGADGLFVKLGATVDKKLIDLDPNLRVIGMFGTGYGRIDVEYAREKKIPVFNIADYATDGVAEFVFATLLSYLRELPRALSNADSGDYSEASFTGTELRDKTLGILGLGNIGSRVAEIASNGFAMNVLYWSRERKADRETERIQYTEVEKLLSDSDYVSLHLALTPETESFLSSKRLGLLRSQAVLINTAPMELLDLAATEKLIADGTVSLILDHSDEMRPEDVQRLDRYSNCVVYPPIAYTTIEATSQKQTIFVNNIIAADKGGTLPNQVN